jgi:hypothetical protein
MDGHYSVGVRKSHVHNKIKISYIYNRIISLYYIKIIKYVWNTSGHRSYTVATVLAVKSNSSSSEVLLGVAVEVVAVADAEHVAVALVVADAVDVGGVLPHAAVFGAVDDVGDGAVAGNPPRRRVGARRRPVAEDHVVARRLGRLRRHPEPDGRLEGDHRVRGHQVRVVHQVLAYRVPGLLVVGLPACARNERSSWQ